MHIVISSFFAGAEIITFFAPAVICPTAFSLSVKRPVHSSTTSILKSFHGSCAGSFTAVILISFPFTTIELSFAFMSASRIPNTESYLRRCARVLASVTSFIATKSKSFSFKDALRIFLPIWQVNSSLWERGIKGDFQSCYGGEVLAPCSLRRAIYFLISFNNLAAVFSGICPGAEDFVTEQ